MNEKVKKGKICGIIALVIGILSFTLCCVAGSVLGVAGIVLGIVSLCKEDAKGMAITGIITSIFGLIIGAVCAFALVALVEIVEVYEEGDPFAGATYETWDGEVVYFDDELEFEWYVDDDNHSDNYSKGEYLAFSGELAEEIINETYDSFGLSLTEVDEIYDYLGIGDYYTEEDLCLLLLVSDQGQVDGYAQEEQVAVFIGCYADEMYLGMDLISGEEVVMYMIDSNEY